ncbi:MAG: MlaD family protein [Candidatus Edwardsbacteria bacterium]|jgi:phospholipid/cholesterol/gamma-HCH transport system substrate-binding protein|nr:MlaD family protein [Candidatus Edwardsbacteria bacterium]
MPTSKLGHELKVGALIVAGLAIALVAVLSVGERQGLMKQKYILYAVFSDVSGLQNGAPVRVSGYQVGVVNDIAMREVDGRNRIVVKLRLEKATQASIRTGSVAKIGSMGLLGDKLVEIVPATYDQPVLQHNDTLRTIEVMPPEEILARAAEIADTIRSAARSLNVIIKKVEYGKGTLGKIIDDPRMYVNLDSLLVTLNHLSLQIKSGQGTLAKLVKDPSLYNNLNQAAANVSVISDSLKRGQGSLGRMLREPGLYATLDSTSRRLNVILGRIEKGEGTLGGLSQDAEMYAKLKSASVELDALIKDIKKNPKKYLSISVF